MAPKTVINVHPKVLVTLATGVGLAVVDAVTTALDPTVFAHLGVYAVPAQIGATILLAAFAGWLKKVDEEDGNGTAATVEADATATWDDATAPTVDVDKLIADSNAAVEAASPVGTSSTVV